MVALGLTLLPVGLVAGLDRLRGRSLVACTGVAVALLGRCHDDAVAPSPLDREMRRNL